MLCPRCSAELKTEAYKGITVDRCPDCQGLWLDYTDLDKLEDVALDEDEEKGTLIYDPRPSDISCPRCGGPMETFDYRAWDLQLDLCKKQDGFWLDRGEEVKVLDLMKERIKDLNRSASAETQWANLLRKVKSKSFFDKVKGLFR
ncbi:MAG: zf-TFIIB domain-containing protein [Dehalococcoidia bacterium]|jgi:Zn-finger nucleic acid-binding protein